MLIAMRSKQSLEIHLHRFVVFDSGHAGHGTRGQDVRTFHFLQEISVLFEQPGSLEIQQQEMKFSTFHCHVLNVNVEHMICQMISVIMLLFNLQ